MTVERVIEKHVLFCTEQSYNKIINSKITLHPQAPILRTLSSVKKTVKAALKLSIMFSVWVVWPRNCYKPYYSWQLWKIFIVKIKWQQTVRWIVIPVKYYLSSWFNNILAVTVMTNVLHHDNLPWIRRRIFSLHTPAWTALLGWCSCSAG